MKFRPCIDIHNGSVKQIVGSTLKDDDDFAVDNFVSDKNGAWFAEFYKKYGLTGGHIILLNPSSSPWYEADKKQAFSALGAWPGGMQIGGGINAFNAEEFIKAGASHVIVTSYVFKDGQINWKNLESIKSEVGKEHLVIDLSCRYKDGNYYIVTDRWQKFTDVVLSPELMSELSDKCSEFLVHAVDVEGHAKGIESEVVKMLGKWGKIPVTYAGGVSQYDDILKLKSLGQDKLDVTIGSALDLFGGKLSFEKIVNMCKMYSRYL